MTGGDQARAEGAGEFGLALARDVLPDGRVDHRGHQKDDQGGYGWVCADCSGEDDPGWVDWTIPYDIHGRPMPKDWRERPYVEVAALCGLPSPSPQQPDGHDHTRGGSDE